MTTQQRHKKCQELRRAIRRGEFGPVPPGLPPLDDAEFSEVPREDEWTAEEIANKITSDPVQIGKFAGCRRPDVGRNLSGPAVLGCLDDPGERRIAGFQALRGNDPGHVARFAEYGPAVVARAREVDASFSRLLAAGLQKREADRARFVSQILDGELATGGRRGARQLSNVEPTYQPEVARFGNQGPDALSEARSLARSWKATHHLGGGSLAVFLNVHMARRGYRV